MAEVVGTALVRIKALTDNLAKDIKKGVDKGVKDAGLDSSGSAAGDDFVEGFDDSLQEGIPSSFENVFDDEGNKQIIKDGGKEGGTSWADGFRDQVDISVGDSFRDLFRNNRDRDIDVGDGGERDGETFGDGFFRGLFRRIRSNDDGDGLFSGVVSGLESAFSGIEDLIPDNLFGRDGGRDRGRRRGRSFGGFIVGGITSAFSGIGDILSKLIFNKLFFNRFTLIAGAIATLAPLIVQLVFGLTAQIGTLVQAALGGVLALVAGVGAGILALGPIIAAFVVDTPLLQAFKEELALIGDEFKVTAEIVQEQVLPAVLTLAQTLVDSLLPAIDEFAFLVGDAFGDFLEVLADFLASESAVSRISIILENSAEAFRRFLQALIPFTDVFLTFFAAVSPLAIRLADDINILLSSLSVNVAQRGIEGLTKTFDGLYNTFTLVLGGLSDITIGLYNVLAIGDASVGQGFFERFREFARDFREFTVSDSGIERIKEIFERTAPILSVTAGIIADIIRALVGFSTGEGATSGMLSFLTFIREEFLPFLFGTFLPAIGSAVSFIGSIFGPVLGALGPFAEEVVKALEPVTDVLSSFASEKSQQLADTFTRLAEGLAKPLSVIGPELAIIFAEFLNVILELSAVLTPVLVELIIKFFEAIALLLSIPGFSEFLGFTLGLAASFIAIVAIGTKVAAIFSTISAIIGALVGGGIVAVLLGIFVAISAIVFLIVKNFDTIKAFFGGIVDAITDLDNIKDIPGIIIEALDDALEALIEWGENAIEIFVDFVEGIPEILGDLGEAIVDGLKEAGKAAAKQIPTIVGLIVEAFLIIFIDLPLAFLKLKVVLIEIFFKAITELAKWIGTTGIPMIIKFFLETLPNFLYRTVPRVMATTLVAIFKFAFNFLTDTLPDLVRGLINFFSELPGRIFRAIGSLANFLLPIFEEAMDGIKNRVGERIDAIVGFFTGLPGRLARLISGIKDAALDIGGAIIGGIADGIGAIVDIGGDFLSGFVNAFKSAWDYVIDKANTVWNNIEFEIPVIGTTVGLPDNVLRKLKFGADGGIFDSPTNMIIGEAGREVLLPLTNPSRTYELALKSGLFDVLERGASGSTSISTVAFPSRRNDQTATQTGQQSAFGPGSVIIYAQGTSAADVYREFDSRTNWKLTSRGDQ